MISETKIDEQEPERWSFYYVHKDGWITTDLMAVQGSCVGVVEAPTIAEAMKMAKERALL
jgi:hypothetical protein